MTADPVDGALGPLRVADTPRLAIAFFDLGPRDGWPVVLSHGFPYDVYAYAEVAPALAASSARVIVPYLRGFGPTRFRSPNTPRTGQQAALARDAIDLLDALGIERAILAGYDWGGLASTVAAALWPGRVTALVSLAAYDVIDVARQRRAAPPALERVLWYQHLFQGERGRACLQRDRRALCFMLWREWSPSWSFDAATFARSAVSLDNPDFVDVVVSAYRFAFGNLAGDPAYAAWETQLAARPTIAVPAVTLDGEQDPLKPGGTAGESHMFTGPHEHRTIAAGHNLPQEAPAAFVDAVLAARRLAAPSGW